MLAGVIGPDSPSAHALLDAEEVNRGASPFSSCSLLSIAVSPYRSTCPTTRKSVNNALHGTNRPRKARTRPRGATVVPRLLRLPLENSPRPRQSLVPLRLIPLRPVAFAASSAG